MKTRQSHTISATYTYNTGAIISEAYFQDISFLNAQADDIIFMDVHVHTELMISMYVTHTRYIHNKRIDYIIIKHIHTENTNNYT